MEINTFPSQRKGATVFYHDPQSAHMVVPAYPAPMVAEEDVVIPSMASDQLLV